METSKTLKTWVLYWAFAASLCAASSRFQDGKNFYFYYTPSPVTAVPPPTDGISYGYPPPAGANGPPVVSYQNPPPVEANNPPAVSYQYPPPAHANEPPAVSYQYPPPAQENNPPSGGGSTPPVHHRHGHHHHHGQKPPSNCDIPPGSGSQNPSPSPPAGYQNSPPPSSGVGTPTAPSSPPVVEPPIEYHNPPPPSGGCSCGNPPSSTPTGPAVAPAPSPTEPSSPTPPATGYHYPPPAQSTTPRSKTPTTTPRSGNHPSTKPPATDDPVQSPPSFPNIPWLGGTCTFWRTHPGLLSDLFTWWSNTIGRAFGLGNIPGFGSTMNLQEALSNTGTDGISALYREGTAALLNSMVNIDFPFTTSHVRDSFVAALASNKVAAAQAEVFRLANEGHFKP